jgi:hypothetical protein
MSVRVFKSLNAGVIIPKAQNSFETLGKRDFI